MSILTALSEIGYPVVHIPYEGEERTFIAFRLINEMGEVFADGEEQVGSQLTSVDLFTPSEWEPKVDAIKLALKIAGYTVQSSGPEMYEEDTRLYHVPILVTKAI